MKILIVVGTRPNFIKITQFKKVAKAYSNFDIRIVHTGQHFDKNMADIFFEQLEIYPDYSLNVNGGGVIGQLTDIMKSLDRLIMNSFLPDIIMVVGDVNSTLAASLVGNKNRIKVAHLESGLRSNDREMPEEINRVLTDLISDYYFITERSGLRNLNNQEMKGQKYFVGNTMIDTLVAFQDKIDNSRILKQLGVLRKGYVLLTLHRPSNVDEKGPLEETLKVLNFLTKCRKVVFPIHPRTRKKLNDLGLYKNIYINSNLIELEPLDYFSFQKLIKESKYVVTDSGGIQEETTFYRVPCLTLRDNTERPSTIETGTNELINYDLKIIEDKVNRIENDQHKGGEIPELWDGKATERILNILSKL